MFQKSLRRSIKTIPVLTNQQLYTKIWLTQLMQDLLIQYEIEESRPLALLLVQYFRGMTIQAQG